MLQQRFAESQPYTVAPVSKCTGHADLETFARRCASPTKILLLQTEHIRSVQEAKQRIEEVGADAVMMCRAAMGNPYLFNQINHYLNG